MKVFVKAVDKDCVLFSVEGYDFWGHLRRKKNCYVIVDLNGREILKVPSFYGKKLEEFINKKVSAWL